LGLKIWFAFTGNAGKTCRILFQEQQYYYGMAGIKYYGTLAMAAGL
jgi:hypothetical protein